MSVGVDSSSEPKGACEYSPPVAKRSAAPTPLFGRSAGTAPCGWSRPSRSSDQANRLWSTAGLSRRTFPHSWPVISRTGQLACVDPRRSRDIPPLDEHPFFKHQVRIVMEDFGVIEPDSIEDAIARGAYSALSKVLFEMTPEEAIAEVTASGLRGRGGAGFPAGIKWESGRKARARPKFVAVNSHEGEPNVYKDRRIHEGDPHRILEGMLIASVVCGAERAYNYIGGEYPLAIKRFRKAVADAERLGLIGKNILGSGQDVEVRVRTGGGAYICGEGSALMYSVMGVRGQPRTKPPRSVEEGLWKRPTVLNNTETFANVPRHHQQRRRVVLPDRDVDKRRHQDDDGPGTAASTSGWSRRRWGSPCAP